MPRISQSRCLGSQLGIERVDPRIQVAPFRPHVLDQMTHPRRQPGRLVGEDGAKAQLQNAPPPSYRDPTLQQNCPELVDQRRTAPHQPLPDAMDRPKVQLGLALQRNEPHGRSLNRLGSGFGIPMIVLVRLDEALDILGRHQPRRVTLRRQRPAQMVGSAARFHADQAGRHIDRLHQ